MARGDGARVAWPSRADMELYIGHARGLQIKRCRADTGWPLGDVRHDERACRAACQCPPATQRLPSFVL